MFGFDETEDGGLQFEMQGAAGGGRFEPDYTLSDVQMLPWGEITLERGTCVQGGITASTGARRRLASAMVASRSHD